VWSIKQGLIEGNMQGQVRSSEIALLCFVSLIAFVANLPGNVTGTLVDRNLLLVTLTVTVVISLFRYLRFMLFLTVTILAIGANLPDQLADQLEISRTVMIFFSGVIVVIALLYKYFGFMSPADSANGQTDTLESRNAVLAAILKRDTVTLHRMLISNVNINFSQNGNIPIFLAIENGYADIVLLLISHGAKLRVKNNMGRTPLEAALLHNDIRIVKIIYFGSKQSFDIRVDRSAARPVISAMANVKYLVAD
jgi:Ankyrin repeats (3 copies)